MVTGIPTRSQKIQGILKINFVGLRNVKNLKNFHNLSEDSEHSCNHVWVGMGNIKVISTDGG